MQRSSSVIYIFTSTLLFAGLFNCTKPKPDVTTSGEASHPQAQSISNPGKVADNRSDIVAKVIEVVELDSARFYLRLQIVEAASIQGYESFAQAGQEINAYPNFRRSEGQVMSFTSIQNQSMLDAKNLKTGDQITAQVYYRGGSGKENRWLLMTVRRQE